MVNVEQQKFDLKALKSKSPSQVLTVWPYLMLSLLVSRNVTSPCKLKMCRVLVILFRRLGFIKTSRGAVSTKKDWQGFRSRGYFCGRLLLRAMTWWHISTLISAFCAFTFRLCCLVLCVVYVLKENFSSASLFVCLANIETLWYFFILSYQGAPNSSLG